MKNSQDLGRRIDKILIIKWSALGDIAMATAVMEDIRIHFDESQIDLNTLPQFSQIFAEDDRFKKILTIDIRKKGAKLRNAFNWLKKVRFGNYDLIIDLQSNDRSRLMLILLKLCTFRSPLILGHHKGFPYNFAPPPIQRKPRGIKGLQSMMGEIGVPAKTKIPIIKFNKRRIGRFHECNIANHLSENDFLILVPGSQASGFLKRWGARKFAELANAVWLKHNLKSCIIGGPDDIEVCQTVHSLSSKPTFNLCGQTSILDLIPIGNRAKAIVANDTGPAHILAACGKPMISICGPTDPIRVKPLGDKVQTIQADVECKSCYLKECPNKHICMESVSVAEVLELVSRCIVLKS